jgi:uncharacterized integral membrane protein (TIGR00698 family)
MSMRPAPAAADLFGDLLETATPPHTKWSDYWPGLFLAGVAAIAAAWLSEHYGVPMMLMGLLIGLALNFANADTRLHPGLGFASKTLLRWGIVLAGAQITFGQIGSLGVTGFLAIVTIMALVMLVGYGVAKSLRLGTGFGILAGGAVAICGASAALALSSLLGEKRASQAQLTLVLVTVAAASAFAMSTYPIAAASLGLTDQQAGFMIGASIHDVAQALGAGYSFSPDAGDTATIVKLTRVTLLAPVLALISITVMRGDSDGKFSVSVPWFVVGFLTLAAANSFFTLPENITHAAAKATSVLLLLAVVATGIRSPMHLLLGQGWRSAMPVLAATLASFILSLAAAYWIAG